MRRFFAPPSRHFVPGVTCAWFTQPPCTVPYSLAENHLFRTDLVDEKRTKVANCVPLHTHTPEGKLPLWAWLILLTTHHTAHAQLRENRTPENPGKRRAF